MSATYSFPRSTSSRLCFIMQLVEKHVISKNHKLYSELDELAFKSKNLYNAMSYIVRQEFFLNSRIMHMKDLYEKSKNLKEYKSLPRKVSGLVMFQVLREWKSYNEATKEFYKHPEKFLGNPKIPKYKNKKDGRNLLQYDIQAISRKYLKNKLIKLSGTRIIFPTKKENIGQVRVVPKKNQYVLEVVYTIQEPECSINPEFIASIDVGLNSLAAITSNKPGFIPVVVNGRQLKSINQYYNKKRSLLQSRLPKDHYDSKQLQRLTNKRNAKIDNYLHLYSRRIADILIGQEIDTLIVGKNDNWKQKISIGRKNNQEFVGIPHARFVQMLEYKCRLVGINFIVTEESYTSKTSFLDNEVPEKKDTYSGYRKNRGLFISSDKKKINADINGSFQIIKKVFPNAFSNGIEGVAVHPTRLSEHA